MWRPAAVSRSLQVPRASTLSLLRSPMQRTAKSSACARRIHTVMQAGRLPRRLRLRLRRLRAPRKRLRLRYSGEGWEGTRWRAEVGRRAARPPDRSRTAARGRSTAPRPRGRAVCAGPTKPRASILAGPARPGRRLGTSAAQPAVRPDSHSNPTHVVYTCVYTRGLCIHTVDIYTV